MKLGQDQSGASTRDSWNQSDLDEPLAITRPSTDDRQDRWTPEVWAFRRFWKRHQPGRLGLTLGRLGVRTRTCWDRAGRHVLHDEGENLFWSLRPVAGVVSGVVLTVGTSCQQRHVSSFNVSTFFSSRRHGAADTPPPLPPP